MEQIGKQCQTDKILHHGYHRYYIEYLDFLHRLHEPSMLEIGIAEKCSLQFWLQYFPDIFVYGIDITLPSPVQCGDRYTLYNYDQSKLSDLQNLATKIQRPIAFINDDGSHIPEHQILSFNYLFAHVLISGGMYIIEDIEVSYWTHENSYGYVTKYGLYHPCSVVEKFKKVLDYINREFLHEHNRTEVEKQLIKEGFDLTALRHIKSISFCQNCICIRKIKKEDLPFLERPYRFASQL